MLSKLNGPIKKMKSKFPPNFSESFVLGKEYIKVTYLIRNHGETAFSPQLRVQIPETKSKLSYVPHFCKEKIDNFIEITCELNTGRPIKQNATVKIDFFVNVNDIDGKKFVLTANVSSQSNDIEIRNNFVENSIVLIEKSEVQIFG